jgi:hypothetical protein
MSEPSSPLPPEPVLAFVPGRSCDGCTMCCKVLEVTALRKPRQKWCPDCAVGEGCKIYETRPDECRAFYCGWMVDATIPDHWAPKHSHMVLAYNTRRNQAMLHVDSGRPDAWRKPPYFGDLQNMARHAASRGRMFLLRTGSEVWALLPQGAKNLGAVRDDQVALSLRQETPRGPVLDVIVVEADDPRLQPPTGAAAPSD